MGPSFSKFCLLIVLMCWLVLLVALKPVVTP